MMKNYHQTKYKLKTHLSDKRIKLNFPSLILFLLKQREKNKRNNLILLIIQENLNLDES